MDAANKWSAKVLGHPIATLPDLTQYLRTRYLGEILIYHAYWVPRKLDATTLYPNTKNIPTQFGNTAAKIYGWTQKTTDRGVALVPFITDECYSGYGTTVSTNYSDINSASAHFQGKNLNSVNCGFADGHVETHPKAKIRPQYVGDGGLSYWWF
jgi:prepilin-type processing-associated H-X9-DG protein